MSKKDMDLITQFASIISKKYNLNADDLVQLWTEETKDYIKLSKIDLQKMCKEKGLKVSGSKAELMLRIQNGGAVGDAQPQQLKSSKKKASVKTMPLIIQKIVKNAPQINVKRNQFGNYEDPETHFVFSETTMKVLGKQNPNGLVQPLDEADKQICESRMFDLI